MSRRPTIADVAKRAGLSVATVDRALNGRHRVRQETLRQISEASDAIGYHGGGLLKRRLKEDLPQYNLGLLVLDQTHPAFFQALAQRFAAAVNDFPGICGVAKVGFLNWESPGMAAEQLRQMGAQTHSVAAVSIDHPTITAAVAELKAKGVPVFSVLTDFAQGVRESYIGVNNRKAGSTAAWLIAKTRKPGKVAIFVGSSRFHGHEMREIGFRAYFRDRAPEFQVIDTMVTPGPPELAYDATLSLLKQYPDLVGLNVAGCGPEGVIQALRDARMAGRLTAICNECTPDSTAALAEEVMTMVIDTPLDWLCRELVTLMLRAIDSGAAHIPGQAFIPFNMMVGENI